MVPLTGIEPVRFIQPRDFKSLASANSATAARMENCFLYFSLFHPYCQGKGDILTYDFFSFPPLLQ